MPDPSPHITLNTSVAPHLERLRDYLENKQSGFFNSGEFVIAKGHASKAIVASSCAERLYKDLTQKDHTIDIAAYAEIYDSDEYKRPSISVYINDDTTRTISKIATLVKATAPDVIVHWRGKVNAKKVVSLALFYCDDVYLK